MGLENLMATLNKTNTTKTNTESFAALFEESMALKVMKPGEIITAEVISIDDDFVITNAGLKSESVIKAEEFYNDKEIALACVSKNGWSIEDFDPAFCGDIDQGAYPSGTNAQQPKSFVIVCIKYLPWTPF